MWSFFAKIKDPDGELIGMTLKKKQRICFEEDSYVPLPWLWKYVRPTVVIKTYRSSDVTCYINNNDVWVSHPVSVRFKLFGVDVSDMDSLGYLYTGTEVEPVIVLVKPIDYHTVPLTKAEFFRHAQCIERKKHV